ncbi:ABC transporter substrate-binding protein [Paenibacillus sp. 32352]|uniref:ABC transporter substrate-binding protein n=1 Tax=Paenibacillus sp. 32352 TaxID=1969111 RepID=UPI0009AD546A|nr:extracellular solute-binding protein [Paenibacillus sp. 32352]
MRGYGWKRSGMMLAAAALIASGCTGGGTKVTEDSTAPPKISSDPVTVKLAGSRGLFTDEELKLYIMDPLAKKYPNITVQYINTSEKGFGLNELITAGDIPDIVMGYGSTLPQLKDLNLLYNMDPLIKKYNLDLNRIIPEFLDYIKVNGRSDFLGGLPAYNNAFALFYNKTLFDKFGVPYPKDGMTWEEVGDLGKKITRNFDGIQYRGFFPDGVARMAAQINLYQMDKDNKSIMATEPWKKAFELWNYIYNYPGNSDEPFNTINFGNNQAAFLKGELAMIAGYSSTLNALRKAPDVNWDVVTYPQHKDKMGYSTGVDTPNFSITSSSKNKDAAFLVIETILSDEVQLNMARNGKMSVLANEQVKQEFGKGIPEFAGKTYNLSSIPRLKPSVNKPPVYTGSDTNKIVIDAYESVLKKEADINTALRVADEQMNNLVQSKIKMEK